MVEGDTKITKNEVIDLYETQTGINGLMLAAKILTEQYKQHGFLRKDDEAEAILRCKESIEEIIREEENL